MAILSHPNPLKTRDNINARTKVPYLSAHQEETQRFADRIDLIRQACKLPGRGEYSALNAKHRGVTANKCSPG